MKIKYTLLFVIICGFLACNNSSDQTNQQEQNSTKVENSTDKEQTQSPASLDSDPPYIITNRQIGPIKIGMPVEELKKIIHKENIKEIAITREGTGNKAYEIRLDPDAKEADLLVEEICKPNCQVWRMHVKSKVIKTAEGLGIGSTLGEVKRFYKINFIGPGETEIVAVSDKSKITFLLDVSKLTEKNIPFLNLSNTPDDVKIIGMFVF